MQILADEPANLYLASEGVITYHNGLNWSSFLFFVGTHDLRCLIYIFFIFFGWDYYFILAGRNLGVLWVKEARWVILRKEGRRDLGG